MNKTLFRIMVLISSAVFLVPFIFFFLFFHGPISHNVVNWASFGGFIGGTLSSIFSFISSFLMIYTLWHQHRESLVRQTEASFFEMLTFHRENVNSINVANYKMDKDGNCSRKEGQRAFLFFMFQLRDCLKLVEAVNKEKSFKLEPKYKIDIAYMIFYYGLERRKGSDFRKHLEAYTEQKILDDNTYRTLCDSLSREIEKIKETERKDLGKMNLSSLGRYFRNLFNMIKLIDSDIHLDMKQKEKYIKILRAQLSDPELYILYFNVISRFGLNWIDNDYIHKYQLFRNLPIGYCGENYEPKVFFKDTDFESEDYKRYFQNSIRLQNQA